MRTLYSRMEKPRATPDYTLDGYYSSSFASYPNKGLKRKTHSSIQNYKTYSRPKETSKISLLMHSLECDFKKSKYHLNQVLSQNSKYWIIKNNEPHVVDVIEDLPCVYKIESKDQPAPIKVTISYNKDDPLCLTKEKLPKTRDIKVQVFLTDEMKPNYKPNFIHKNKLNFTIDHYADTIDKFETNTYLVFSSAFGCSLTVRAKFPEETTIPQSRLKQNYTVDHQLDHEEFAELLLSNQPNKYETLIKEIDTGTEIPFLYKKIRDSQIGRKAEEDRISFIKNNKKRASQYIKTLPSKTSLKSFKRAKSCAQKKRRLEQQNRLKKIFLAKKWDIIKEKRAELQRQQIVERNRKRAAVHLLKVLFVKKYIKKIYKDYDKFRFELESKELIVASAVKIFLFFKRNLGKVHPSILERTKLNLQNSFMFANCIQKDSLELRAKKLTQTHLEKTSIFYNFTQQSMIFRCSALVIQKEYKKRFKTHKERLRILTDNWKGEIERQIKYKTKSLNKQKKNTKKIKKELKILTSIPDPFRDLVLRRYYEFMLVKHKLKLRETENYLIQHYEQEYLKYDNEHLIQEIEDRKLKLFGKPEMTVLEIDFKMESSPKKSRAKHTVGFGATTESIFVPNTTMTKSKKITNLFSKKFEEDGFPDDKSVPLAYPDFEYTPSNKELLFLIEKAKGMKSIEEIDEFKQENRKSKFSSRNMMRIERKTGGSSISHYS